MHDVVIQTEWSEEYQEDLVVSGVCSCGWESDNPEFARNQIDNHRSAVANVEIVEAVE